jgi:hypothetical protein
MNIRQFEVEETAVVELNTAADEPMIGEDGKPMTITVYGPGSKQHAAAQAVSQNRMFDRMRKKGKVEQTADEKARENVDFLVACTKEFSANIQVDDLKGEELYRAVYGNRKLGFIGDQVAKVLGEWGSFTKASHTS